MPLVRFLCMIVYLLFFCLKSLAFDIQIDPGGYLGNYSVIGQTGTLNGVQTVSLDEGSYYIVVGSISSFQFSIDASGFVSVSGDSGVGSSLSLIFNNVEIDINVNAYSGSWSIPSVLSTTNGSKADVILVPSQNFVIQIGALDSFTINLDGQGDISSISNPGVATYIGNSLTFNTKDITVDPQNYVGIWQISTITGQLTGEREVKLIPGLQYSIQIGAVSSFSMSVDTNGDVTSISKTDAATAEDAKLIFNNVSIDVDVGNYEGEWLFPTITQSSSGSKSNTVFVPGLTYVFQVAAVNSFFFNVLGDGNLEILNGISANVNGSLMTLNTSTIEIDPGSYGGIWKIAGVINNQSGVVSDVKLVKGITYLLQHDTFGRYFKLEDPCNLDPSSLDLNGDVFMLECVLAYNFLGLRRDQFNPIDSPLEIEVSEGSYSTNISDFSVFNNSQPTDLSLVEITNNNFYLPNFFKEGQNLVVFDGKDLLGNDIHIEEEYWTGSATVEVDTEVPSQVTISIDYNSLGESRTFSVTKLTVDNKVVFKNVPQRTAKITTTAIEGFIHSEKEVHIQSFTQVQL